MRLSDEIAQVLYSEDSTSPWSSSSSEERDYYYKVADVMIDVVVTHLEEKKKDFPGALEVVIDLLRSETELVRLHRGHWQ